MTTAVICVLLVSLINYTAFNDIKGSLFSYSAKENEIYNPLKNRLSAQENKNSNLAMAPLSTSVFSIDEIDFYEEDYIASPEWEVIPSVQSQAVLAIATPQNTNFNADHREVKEHVVKEGDTISSIAASYGISISTVLSANNLSETSLIKPGEKITILPITGVKYKVQKNDTVEAIALKFNADPHKIIAYNQLPANGELREKQDLIIPDGYISPSRSLDTTDSTRLAQNPSTNTTRTLSYNTTVKLDGLAGKGHRFPYGYCTWYVSQRRYIPWGGNAGSWLQGARLSGVATGSAPRPGAIVVTRESGYGHVAIVEKVDGNTFTISEMNYRGWGKKSTRTLSTKSPVIKGFIY